MSGRIAVVYFDVGGPLYDDRVYAEALLGALRSLGSDASRRDFWAAYEKCRIAQAGVTAPLARRFGVDAQELARTAARAWRYPPGALQDDALPTLKRLGGGYRLGVLANQPAATRSALARDGVASFISLWVISEEVGVSKPDGRLFARAVALADCPASAIAYVGNRIDNDMRPARTIGMRPILLLRGEAPPAPTPAQRAEADAVIESLEELPEVLATLDGLAVPPR